MIQEIRTVVKEADLEKVINYFDKSANKKDYEKQVIYNYHTEGDLRLIRTNSYVKLSFKDNNDNDVVYISKKYEKDLLNMFKNIGISIEFKRFRERYKYIYNNIYITLDKGVKIGNILRFKFKYKNEEEKNRVLSIIKEIMDNLNIEETSVSKFEELYGKYRTSWNDLVGDMNEDIFLK